MYEPYCAVRITFMSSVEEQWRLAQLVETLQTNKNNHNTNKQMASSFVDRSVVN